MQEYFLQLYKQGRPTVLFVTHNVDEGLLMADRSVVMGIGRIIADVAAPAVTDGIRRIERLSVFAKVSGGRSANSCSMIPIRPFTVVSTTLFVRRKN